MRRATRNALAAVRLVVLALDWRDVEAETEGKMSTVGHSLMTVEPATIELRVRRRSSISGGAG